MINEEHNTRLKNLPPTEQEKIKRILDQIPTGYMINFIPLSREGLELLMDIIEDRRQWIENVM